MHGEGICGELRSHEARTSQRNKTYIHMKNHDLCCRVFQSRDHVVVVIDIKHLNARGIPHVFRFSEVIVVNIPTK